MHLEQVGGPDGPWRETYDIDRCQNPECGQLFGPGRFGLGLERCGCTEAGDHRTFRCRACNAVSYDPPHHGSYGPTADYS